MTVSLNRSGNFGAAYRNFIDRHAPKGGYDRDVFLSDLQGVLNELERETIVQQIRRERREAVPTDEGAAERLLERLSREVSACFEAENLHSAEDLLTISARRYLERVAGVEKSEQR